MKKSDLQEDFSDEDIDPCDTPVTVKQISFEERLLRICIGFLPTSYADIDRRIKPFQTAAISPEPYRWLKRARITLQLTTRTVAERAGIHHTSYAFAEKAELDGAVTIESMRLFADAMGCEFVYAIRPRNRESFTEQIWNPIRADAEKKINQRRYFDEDSRYRVLGQMMGRIFQTPKFRRKYGWSERYPRRD